MRLTGQEEKDRRVKKNKPVFSLFLSLRLSTSKIAGAGILFVGGGIGGTILYAKWDSHFPEECRENHTLLR